MNLDTARQGTDFPAFLHALDQPRWSQEPATRKERAFDLVSLFSSPPEPQVWVVEDLIPEGVALLGGSMKLGKSWFCQDLAASVAAGRPFLDMPVNQGNVLYYALEDGRRRLYDRMTKILGTDRASIELGTFEFRLDPALLGGALEVQLSDWAESVERPRLIVIDTLGRVKPSAEEGSSDGGYSEAVRLLAPLQALAEKYHLAIVLVHHSKKNVSDDADVFEAFIGSQGYASTADTLLLLRRKRGEDVATLDVTGRDHSDQPKFKMWWSATSYRWTIGDGEPLGNKLLRLVAANPGQSSTQLVKEAGERRQRVLDELKSLRDWGSLRSVAGPRNADLWWLA